MSGNGHCPDSTTWQRFLAGLVPEEEAGPLEDHLSLCPSCLATIGIAHPDEDGFLTSCRSLARKSDSHPDLFHLDALVGRLRELIRVPAAGQGRDPSARVRAGPLPAHIGRYRVLRLLGKGGMGTVYLAEDPQLRRQVALKVPHGDGVEEGGARRFLREARSAAAVRHPHVCPIYDVGVADDAPYVVMAFIQGESLAERLKRDGRFQDRRAAARLALQVVDGLAAVHAQGIIHRDLKPSNILLDAAGQALLTDFGLARPAVRSERLTSPSVLAGTPAYMAPEQVCPELGEVSPRTDIYSMGVILYEMLTGQRPFQGTSVQVLAQLAVDNPKPANHLQGDLDPALAHIIHRAMARRPEDRYASASMLGDALRAWLDEAPLAHFRPRRRSRLLFGGVLVFLLLIGLGLLALRAPTRSHHPLPSPAESAPSAATFQGWIDIALWDEVRPERRGLRLGDAGALPLKENDAFRVEAQLNRPAYLYLFWIDSAGQAVPVYPWKPGHWDERPAEEKPVQRLSLPPESDSGWPLGAGPAGMESLVLLARRTPLPRDVDLRAMLSGLPPQARQRSRSAVWFENGEVVSARQERERAPRFFDPKHIDDPVLRTQRLLKEKLAPLCDYNRAVCFSRQ